MTRLPTPGGDDGDWGNILNSFLGVSHAADGSLAANTVDSTQIKSGAVSSAKLDSATQTQLAQGASAYQKPAGGIPATDLTSGVQASLSAADNSVQAVSTGTAVSTSGALAVNAQSYCNAGGGNLTMTLPTGQAGGSRIIVTKSESSANTVTVTGSIQGVAAQSYILSLIGQTVEFVADSSGSWWPLNSRYDLSALDNRYQLAGSAVGASLAYSQLATGVGGFSISATFVDIPGVPLTISPVLGTRAVEIQARLTVQPAAATTVSIAIYDATASTLVANAATTTNASGFVTVPVSVQVTPGAGTRTYRPQIAATSSTTCNVYGTNVNSVISYIAAIQR